MLVLMLLTKRRLTYAETAVRSLEHLKTSEQIHFHIADDGSGDEYTSALVNVVRETLGQVPVTKSDSHDQGYGANFNSATQIIHSLAGADIVLPLEDDWELIRDLELDVMIQALRENIFNCIRLGYLGYTQSLVAKLVYYANMHWLELNEFSSEPHVFAGHPRLETIAWEREVGPWSEELGAGATEFEVAKRNAARRGVAWPMELVNPQGDAWVHIGSLHAIDPVYVEHARA